MPQALAEAKIAAQRGEVPVGAVLSDAKGHILAQNGNRMREYSDPSAHAEILVIRKACADLGTERLPAGCTLTITLEPCPMCAAALAAARVDRIIFGASDPKSGGVEHGPRIFTHSTCHHLPEVISGVDEAACAHLLKEFFVARR